MSALRLTPSILFLIAANLVPLYGVFQWGWKVGDILILYWIENVIIGVLNIPKMWACEGHIGRKIFNVPFFAFHYGMFCFGHGIMIADIFGNGADLLSWVLTGFVYWTAVSFLVSHSFSMIVNFFGLREYAGRDVQAQMFLPYGRIVALHIVVLIGGLMVQALGSPVYALLLLIVIKTMMDIAAHRIEHKDKGAIKMRD